MFTFPEVLNNNQWDFIDLDITVGQWFIILFVGLSLIAICIEIYSKFKK